MKMQNSFVYNFNRMGGSAKTKSTHLFLWCSFLLFCAVNIRGLGTLWAVLMASLSAGLIYLGRNKLFHLLLRHPLLLSLPVLFPLSSLWSEAPFVSLSLGLQSLLTVLAGISIVANTSRDHLHLLLFYSIGAVCLTCLMSNQQGAAAEGMVLVGYLGSKDAMGLFAYLGVMTSSALVFEVRNPPRLRLFALVVTIVELWIATSVHATTALLAVVMGLMMMISTYLFFSRSFLARWWVYLMITAIACVCFVYGGDIVDILLDMAHQNFGKDKTLTGRTILWENALDVFISSPLLGDGYRAFWVGGSPESQMMLARMGVSDGRGFHFHQQYLETLADLGFIGALALIATFSRFIYVLWNNATKSPDIFSAYSIAVCVVYIVRWFFETAFLPFSFDMMVLYCLAAAALTHRSAPTQRKPKYRLHDPLPL